MRLSEVFVMEGGGTTGPAMQPIIDRISNMDGGDWVGDTDDARHLIMALIDQAGYSVQDQKRFAQMLGMKGES